MLAKAAVNFVISTGVRLFPEFPPIVPLIPDMLLISATLCCFLLMVSPVKFDRDAKISF
jgi:hypothetical protein